MTWKEFITPEEKEVVEELKKRTINDCTPKMLEDEFLFYRFAKAREFNLQNAEIMLRKHLIWRKETETEKILTEFTVPEVFVKYQPSNFIGYDKEGSPVRYVDVGVDTRGILESCRNVDYIKSQLVLIEQDMEKLQQQSQKLGRPITKVLYIYNFEKISLFTATHKRALDVLSKCINMYQDNYPERVKKIFCINASYLFKILFAVIKSVLAASILEKIQVYGSDGWQEALLQHIDADELPAFLGGRKTDPDGDPLCKSFVVHAAKVPDSFYLPKSERTLCTKPGVKKIDVSPFSKEEVEFEVKEINSSLEWEFETKRRDIGFAVYFKKNDSKPVEIIPKQTIDTCFEPESGILKCEDIGTYTIVFDNSSSWMHSKEIYYIVRVLGPQDIEMEEENSIM